jgi:glycosyltransferase involved in cell wall biosynthesis
MNLAILIARFPPGVVGGAEIQAQEWARRLAEHHRVTVITRRDPPSQEIREARDGFEVLRLPRSGMPVWRTWTDLRGIDRAIAALGTKPELLLCFQTFVSGLAGVRIQRRQGIPAVVWIRGETEYQLVSSWRARLIGPGVWRDATGVLVQTEEIRLGLLEELARRTPALVNTVAAHLDVVPNGIELPSGPFARGDRVLYLGRLIHDKGVDTVIKAVATVHGRLTIAGDGPERGALEATASGLRLDARFEGMVSRERVGALYREAKCVVLAARRGEGMPNVLLEAMAHARPVIATPIGGIRNLIVNDVNGLLVPPDDSDALGQALVRLEREKGLADRLGAAARATAAGFGWDAVRPRLEALLDAWRKR